jgi:hypothetical protein
MTKINRRRFVKITATTIAGSAAALSGIHLLYPESFSPDEVTVWDVPGGEFLNSPDYAVTLKRGRKTWTPHTSYSYSKGVDKIIDHEEEGHYIKASFGRLQSWEYKHPEDNLDTYAHSWTYFDFSGGPVEVHVKIMRPLDGLTLPLQSCGVFPSTLGIECEITGPDSFCFMIEKPVKIAIVPNHIQALEKLETAHPKQAFEGYRNPLFLFARNHEVNVPRKEAEGTLVVKPGQLYGVEDFNKAGTIWFESGIHDYSKYNPDDPNHYIYLNKGQTIYLEGGAFLYGIFNSEVEQPLSDMPLVRGRGIISGDKQLWTGTAHFYTLIKNVCLDGVHIIDPHNHITHGLGYFKDVAVVGAWHGNTDGIGRRVYIDDPFQGWHAEDCFCMAGDTNMAIGGFGRIKNHTMWQLNNAEPMWVWAAEDCVAEDIYIIAYNRYREGGQAYNLIRNKTEPQWVENKMKNKNVVIDAPFIPRFLVATSDKQYDKPLFKEILFENVVINSPHIREKSPIGFINECNSDFGRIVFRNIVINGTRVTESNFNDYFSLLNGVSLGREVTII